MRIWLNARTVLHDHWRTYLLLNLAVYGVLVASAVMTLLIPYLGVVLTLLRTATIGIWLTPTTPGEAVTLLPHLPVIVIELQAYVLAALGTVVLWRSTFRRRHLGLPTAGAGYRAGLADLLRLYPVIAAVLLLIAVVEAVEVIWIMRLLR